MSLLFVRWYALRYSLPCLREFARWAGLVRMVRQCRAASLVLHVPKPVGWVALSVLLMSLS